LIVGTIAGYFWLSPPPQKKVSSQKQVPPHVEPSVPATPVQNSANPEPPAVPQPPQKKLNDYPLNATIPETDKPDVGGGATARLAIIIDDMGSSLAEARSLAAIKVPLTFSIIPGLRVDKEVASYAAANKIETMIHIPMQSKGWPARRLEENGLLMSMDVSELQERVSAFVQQFPGASGANNHMGSEFTEHDEKMMAVLMILRKRNLFFVDSVTTQESVGLRVAQRLGIRSARRNVFLDNEQERRYILGQLKQAVRMARKNGSAIAICHPHPETIATLASALPELDGQGVQLVSASQLVK
jgi:polysaccharide deacetylase 2 family uncharacterized protein YibQ